MGSSSQPKITGASTGEIILDVVNTQKSHTGDTSQTTVYTFTVPGGTLGANGALKIDSLWSCDNNANVKTVRVKFGTATMKQQALTSKTSGFFTCTIFNRNDEASQIMINGLVAAYGTTTSAMATPTIDTSDDVDVTFTVENASAGDTTSLEAATISVIRV